ncbi:MAG TPA: hypothetical protein PK655_00725 [archaeon]|jgi:hypothetical protein|nr:hypothetical protein [archaeon]HPV65962.1 hypothetical protein [archaeon]
MAKKNNSSLILWTLVSLIIGILLGLLITSLATTGQATSNIYAKSKNEMNNVNTSVSIDDYLRLDQGFDNVSGYNYKNYIYMLMEFINSNVPATVNKDSSFTVGGYTTGNYDNLKLDASNGYSTQGYTYSYIPFNQNNLAVYSSINGEFILENGHSIYKHHEAVENESGYQFAEVTYFDFDCSGQYEMGHKNAGNISDVHFYLSIYNPNNADFWYFDWDSTPQRNYFYTGFFPNEANTILANGLDYYVNLAVDITTSNQLLTSASTYKQINCQTMKQKSLSSNQLEILKEKSGNTPKQISEKLAKK